MNHEEHATLILGDLHPSFINLARRLQQVAKLAGRGISVVSVTVFVDCDEAIQWTRPSVEKLTLLEPRGGNDEFCDKLKVMRR
jgi:hypothetical protein